LQFLYGEDGMDAVAVEKQKFDTVLMSIPDIESKYRFEVDNPHFGENILEPEVPYPFFTIFLVL